jgi:hypothetical protein
VFGAALDPSRSVRRAKWFMFQSVWVTMALTATSAASQQRTGERGFRRRGDPRALFVHNDALAAPVGGQFGPQASAAPCTYDYLPLTRARYLRLTASRAQQAMIAEHRYRLS